MTQINVNLTPNHALTADADNFVILTRKLVDPTRSPNYKADSGVSTELREEWKDPKYFSLNSAGLAASLDYVRIRTVANSGVTDLAELVALIRDTTAEITDALRNGAKLPNISVVVTSEG
ncbi:hypothetical protein J2T13_000220 [Paenibacillus sp. DS2015]|uniref:hypothetical protein n=1 Tax=Paenibacillus sp. DS2015 TaxID=3373917 RepID=UPI003D204BAF